VRGSAPYEPRDGALVTARGAENPLREPRSGAGAERTDGGYVIAPVPPRDTDGAEGAVGAAGTDGIVRVVLPPGSDRVEVPPFDAPPFASDERTVGFDGTRPYVGAPPVVVCGIVGARPPLDGAPSPVVP
jgi:hypothetical protein